MLDGSTGTDAGQILEQPVTPAAETPVPATPATPAAAQTPAQTGQAATTTLLSGEAATPATPAAPPTWPADWRAQMLGEDKGAAKQIERYASPADVWKKVKELEKIVSSGAHKTQSALPENATPEQMAEWRQAQGIPESPDGYKPELPNGMVLGEADKPLVDTFAAYVHGKNWSPKQFNEALGWYFEQQNALVAQKQADDRIHLSQSRQELQKEWGPEYNRNINVINNTFDGDVLATIINARGPDGRLNGNNPAVVRFLLDRAIEINPLATLTPAGVNGPDLDTEIQQIEKRMRDDRAGYFKDARAQERYRDLLSAREQIQARTPR